MAFIGVNETARKLTGAYVGVDGVARKVTKIYVGVDGVARLVWSFRDPSAFPTLLPRNEWAASHLGRLNYTTDITFLNSYVPTAGDGFRYVCAIDEGKTGSIKLYTVDDYTRHIYIVGNGSGGIYANPDSAFMFSGQGGGVNASISDFTNLRNINGLDLLDTSKVTSMARMFDGDQNLQKLNLTNFDTSNVTKMGAMFCNCSSLTSLDLRSFDTRKVTDMGLFFYNTTNLKTIIVSRSTFSTAQANTTGMFSGCGTYDITYV